MKIKIFSCILKKRIKEIASLFIVVLLMMAIISCSSKRTPVLAHKSYGEFCSVETQNNLIGRLSILHVNITYFGDRIVLCVKTGHLFDGKSVNLQRSSFKVLDTIADFLMCYQKMSVEVAGYTNLMKNKSENRGLSRLQAQQVANYLWKKGVKARLIYAQGNGVPTIHDPVCGDCRIEVVTVRLP